MNPYDIYLHILLAISMACLHRLDQTGTPYDGQAWAAAQRPAAVARPFIQPMTPREMTERIMRGIEKPVRPKSVKRYQERERLA